MRKGKSVWFSQRATSRGEKTLKRCKTNVEADNAVLIDLDSDDSHNVIHVDVPEVLRKKSRIGTVIHIDDDDDDENSDHSPPGSREASGDHLNNDASTSERVSPASNPTHNSMDKDGDECEIIQDNLSPFKFSKCKRTYSERSSGRNRYGLGPDSDIDLCDDDLSDCEILEVSWGKVKEQWEKANTKRKCDVPYGQSGNCNETTASHPTPQKADVEDLTSNQTKDHSSPSSCNARYDGDTTASHPTPQKADVEDDHSSPRSCNARYDGDMPSPHKRDVDDMFGTYSSGDPFSNLDAHSTPIRHHFDSKGIYPEGDGPWPAGQSSNTHEGNTYEHEECNNAPFVAEVNCEPPEPYLFSSPRKGKQQVSHVNEFSVPKEKDLLRGTFTSHLDPLSGIEERLAQSKTNIPDESIPSYRPQHGFKTNVNHGSGAFPKAFFPEPCPPMDSELGSETGAVPVDSRREDRTVNSGIEEDNGFAQVPNRTIAKESSFCSDPRSKVHSELNMGETDLSNEKHDQVHSEDVDDGQTIHPSIINDKEKLKETDEYKRAAEEEWASRQRELQIQAEEAQRLKRLVKRKKAENMRVLDMERRQRQRVEEMREIQKKDEEDMNMKEQLRSEIRKELNQLEISCRDMATLLRRLGIEVGSGIIPLPHEVKAAYKRALLCFHPDRASGSDIRQLVEAEEKFKLISRMKEKLLVVT